MNLHIEKIDRYAESNVTIIGLTQIYGRPQYVLVDSPDSESLKFPGLQFTAPKPGKTLEDSARDRFEEQTGLPIEKMLGLRAVVPSRSWKRSQWMFKNVFLGVVGACC